MGSQNVGVQTQPIGSAALHTLFSCSESQSTADKYGDRAKESADETALTPNSGAEQTTTVATPGAAGS